jgi:hypothetical protein
MRELIISIVISTMAPVLIGLAMSLRIRRRQRESEAIGKPGHALRIRPVAAIGGRPRNRLAVDLVCGAFIAVALGLLLAAGPADAKPKLGVECSVAQTVKASACVKKIEQDLMNNVANPHMLTCLADGTVACCKKSNIGPGYNCTYVRVGASDGVTSPLGNATNAPATNPSPPPGVFSGAGVLHRAQ